MKDIPKAWFLTGKQFEDFRRKKYISYLSQANHWKTQPLNATIDDGPCNQEEKNWKKIEKSIRVKTVKLLEHCKTRSDKSNPDMLNFYVVLAGLNMVIDAGRANKCTRNFKAPSLQSEVQNMEDVWKNWVFTGKQFEDFRRKKNRNNILDLLTKPTGAHGP